MDSTCPHCGGRKFLGLHTLSWKAGLISGTVTGVVTFIVLMVTRG